MLKDLKPLIRFQPTKLPIEFAEKWRLVSDDQNPSLWRRKTAAELLPSQRVSYREVFDLDGSPSGKLAPLRLEIKASAGEAPLKSLGGFQFDIERLAFRFGKVVGEPTYLVMNPKCEVQKDKKWVPATESGPGSGAFALRITYPFEYPEAATWHIYRIRIRAGDGNLMTPSWVQEFSTHTDQTPADGGRTLHLDYLVESMIRGISEQVVILDHFVNLGRS